MVKVLKILKSNNNMTLAEAKKAITSKELKELGWDVEEYIRKGYANSYLGNWDKELENASAKYHITRLDAIKMQMKLFCDKAFTDITENVTQTLSNVYKDVYYRTAFEVQKGIGVGFSFAQIDERRLKLILEKPWAIDGTNFSERIWGTYRPKLTNKLQQALTDWCVRGTDPKKLARQLSYESGIAQSACNTLIQTETAQICTRAAMESYDELGVENYRILEALDGKTCGMCADMDSKLFNRKDFEIGVTAPPFHPRCRGNTIPEVDDDLLKQGRKRAARDENGKTIYVDDMSYKQWKEKFVTEKGQQAWDYYEKSAKNKGADKKQHEKYKAVLGKNAPKSLEEFQKLKYTNSEEWDKIKSKVQEELPKMDFDRMELFVGTLSNRQTRLWYKYHDENIPNIIDKTKSLEEQAREACELRNTYRTQARDLMKDQEERKRLDSEHPNISFEELVEYKKLKYGLKGDAIYKDIIRSSQTTNKKYDKKAGLEE